MRICIRLFVESVNGSNITKLLECYKKYLNYKSIYLLLQKTKSYSPDDPQQFRSNGINALQILLKLNN